MTVNQNPEGSYVENIESGYGIQMWVQELSSIPSGESTVELQYQNLASMELAEVRISLGPINCDGVSCKVSLVNGDESYEAVLPSGYSGKLISFNDIPAAFLANFTVKNGCESPFFHADNMLTIIPKYQSPV
jgi:hypothetical protein